MSGLKQFWRVFVAFLREIGDENAYQRHLAAHNRPHSASEWRRFYEHRLQHKYRQSRCC